MVQLAVLCVILVGILTAIQFPIRPWIFLLFSIATTATIGTVTVLVGGVVSPLPLFALLLVIIIPINS